MSPRYLVDTSAFARMRQPAVATALEPLILGREVAICDIVTLEILYSARGARDLKAVREELTQALISVPTEQQDFDRAIEVMEVLAERGEHRAVPLPDLLVAAVAERVALCVLHYDEDFDRIAKVTGQDAEWVVPRGAIS